MFLEILGNALFLLIGFCIICGIVFIIVYSIVNIYHGIDRSSNYVEKLTNDIMKKYSFKPGDKFWKDDWKSL